MGLGGQNPLMAGKWQIKACFKWPEINFLYQDVAHLDVPHLGVARLREMTVFLSIIARFSLKRGNISHFLGQWPHYLQSCKLQFHFSPGGEKGF